jgi:tetratricopeptide (TPR) repeat protein
MRAAGFELEFSAPAGEETVKVIATARPLELKSLAHERSQTTFRGLVRKKRVIFVNEIIALYDSLGPYAKAEPLHQRALRVDGKVLGPEHPDVATDLVNLAFIYLADGRIDKAFEIFKQQNSSMGLGRCYLAKNDYAMAKGKFESSLKNSQQSKEIEFIIANHLGLGLSYEGMGNLLRAGEHFKKAVEDYERFINEIKLQDTELASIITVEATPVEKIQALLDSSTTILEYFTTKDSTYAWLITRNDIRMHEIDLGQKRLLAMVNPRRSEKPSWP